MKPVGECEQITPTLSVRFSRSSEHFVNSFPPEQFRMTLTFVRLGHFAILLTINET